MLSSGCGLRFGLAGLRDVTLWLDACSWTAGSTVLSNLDDALMLDVTEFPSNGGRKSTLPASEQGEAVVSFVLEVFGLSCPRLTVDGVFVAGFRDGMWRGCAAVRSSDKSAVVEFQGEICPPSIRRSDAISDIGSPMEL